MRAHRAMYDVEVMVHIFDRFARMLPERGCVSPEDILTFQSCCH
jgi:DNA polymerase III alpha subunit (gram-positive type)